MTWHEHPYLLYDIRNLWPVSFGTMLFGLEAIHTVPLSWVDMFEVSKLKFFWWTRINKVIIKWTWLCRILKSTLFLFTSMSMKGTTHLSTSGRSFKWVPSDVISMMKKMWRHRALFSWVSCLYYIPLLPQSCHWCLSGTLCVQGPWRTLLAHTTRASWLCW